jgi:hypothetical protein
MLQPSDTADVQQERMPEVLKGTVEWANRREVSSGRHV